MRDKLIMNTPYDKNIFPPVSFEETYDDLKDRDELEEINKEQFKNIIVKRFENLESEINDLKKLMINFI
jgi:hypothetical protein